MFLLSESLLRYYIWNLLFFKYYDIFGIWGNIFKLIMYDVGYDDEFCLILKSYWLVLIEDGRIEYINKGILKERLNWISYG